MRRLIPALALVLAALPLRAAHTQARLILSHDSAKPGATITAGVHLKMDPGWHTYWQNGGDSGAPTTIEWTIPKGVTAGDIQWPVPDKTTVAGETTFNYHDNVVLLVPLTLATDVSVGKLELMAKVAWLECEQLCVPGSIAVEGALSVGESKPSKDAALLDTWKAKLPQTKPGLDARAAWEAPAKGDSRPMLIAWTTGPQTKEADFFPYGSEKFMVKAATETVNVGAGSAQLRKSVEKLDSWPTEVAGLLIERGEGGKLLGAYEVKLPIRASLSATAPAPSPTADAKAPTSLLAVLGGAFLGGLILNLMPCVLPVLALKVFGFVAQSRESPATVRKHGLLYGSGVLVSFLLMAAVVIGLKAAGKSVSWGMQFGDARFLVVMTTLVTLVALNFFGLFEITLGGGAMDKAAEFASREGPAGAFFNGVLATALATPCTAPFLATAMGFALAPGTDYATVAISFVAVAAGLASPYVVLSFQPGWLRFLPKPGAWMEKFRTLMGFPMMATAVWLFTLTIDHYGDPLWFGFFLVIVAMAAWVFGQFVQRGVARRGIATGVAAALLVLGYAFALESQLHWRTPPQKIASTGEEIIKEGPDGIEWRRWSTAAVAKARAEGRPVFVDFTAKWCVTCNANKKTSIEIASVRRKLKEINALPLLGDYTRVPDDITQELQRFGRAGVPLVLVYPKDASKDAIVLPALLTPSIVLDALDKAVN